MFRQTLTNFTDLKWEKAAFDPSGPASVYLACRDCHPLALLNHCLSHVSSQLSCDWWRWNKQNSSTAGSVKAMRRSGSFTCDYCRPLTAWLVHMRFQVWLPLQAPFFSFVVFYFCPIKLQNRSVFVILLLGHGPVRPSFFFFSPHGQCFSVFNFLFLLKVIALPQLSPCFPIFHGFMPLTALSLWHSKACQIVWIHMNLHGERLFWSLSACTKNGSHNFSGTTKTLSCHSSERTCRPCVQKKHAVTKNKNKRN